MSEKEEKEILARFLKDYIEEDDNHLTSIELVTKYQDEITDLAKHDKDTAEVFGFVNTRRVFGEVARELSYPIFMAEVEQVGYKRTKRGEKSAPNELYRTDEA